MSNTHLQVFRHPKYSSQYWFLKGSSLNIGHRQREHRANHRRNHRLHHFRSQPLSIHIYEYYVYNT